MPLPARPLFLATALATLAACSGSELVGFHVTLKGGGAAQITTRALVDAPKPGPAEVQAKGIQWSDSRAALVHSQGTVTDLAAVRFGDDSLRFVPRLEGEGPSLRVYLQRGPDKKWVQCLALPKAVRTPLAKLYDPTGKTSDFAQTIRLEVEGATAAIASSVHPSARGVEAGREGNRAFLLVPVETAIEAGPELIWQITWQ